MKTKSTKLRFGFLALMTCLSAQAQFAIDWSTIDGGGTSSGGGYAISGTIGQPDAGQLTGGSYSLSGGFWPSQVEELPLLTASRSGGSVVVHWPFPSTGYVLEESAGLVLWTEVTTPAAVRDGDDWTVTIPESTRIRFFRLNKP